MTEQPSRKLAVLLHADVVGSTSLVQLDETLAHQRIQDTFKRFSETITSHSGAAREIRGDALVAEFSMASNAVSAALAFQSSNAAHNEELPDQLRPVVRVGIAMGEVVVADNTVTGEGIVLAQRLEQLAEPGSVCIQDAAYQTIPKRLPFEYEDLGEHRLKGFEESVRVYVVRRDSHVTAPGSEAPAQREEAAFDLPDKPSIAVLPFTNMSGDPEQEYFSDGLTEDIITALSHWRSVPVIARNSSFTYKGQSVRVQKVAEELGVRYIVEGSVRKAGNRLRITVQLIDGESGHHAWAEKFDRQLDDVFEVQDEITNRIAATIVPELELYERRRSATKRTRDLSAWDYYLRGLDTFFDETCESTAASLKMFQSAVEADPEYCDAWARLGWAYAREVMFDCSEDRQSSLQKGFEAAHRAVALDDASALAHLSLGTLYILD